MKDLTEREKLIIEFYEEGEIPIIYKIIEYIKGVKNEFRSNRRMDTTRDNKLLNNDNNCTRFN